MEVGPPDSPCRRRFQTAAVSFRSRAGVGSDCGKGPLPAGQVGDEKTNVSEPLMTHRNRLQRHRNWGPYLSFRTTACPVACPQPGGGLRARLVVPGV